MEFRILGPVELWSAGRQRDLGPEKERCLLAILLLALATVVPIETLIDQVWDGRPPAKAPDDIASYISRLRKRLRGAVGDRVRLIGRAHGYVLEAAPETVDFHRFQRLRRQAGEAARRGDLAEAAQLLRAAEGLWRGEALGGLATGWAVRMRNSLDEERRAVTLDRVALDLQLGRHTSVLGELRLLRERYPLDEALTWQDMAALHASGRRSEALSVYRETRRRLNAELGTEPGQALSDLHQRILASDPSLDSRPPRLQVPDTPSLDTLPPVSGQFVGRTRELQLLTSSAARSRSVVVVEGMAGVGKTRLAIQAARQAATRYPNGALYLDLHSHDPAHEALSPSDALHRMLLMVSVPPDRMPRSTAERSVLWRAELARRRAVVILDDASAVDQIQPLLPTGGGCLIIVTTRVRLPGLAHATALSLGVLPAGDAVTLFTRLCGLDKTLDHDEVTEVVQLAGRLPLAIHLIASRVRQSPSARLRNLITELSGHSAPVGRSVIADERLASAFDLSYRDLDTGQRRLFRLLGAQPCASVTAGAAAALAGASLADTETDLAALLDRHLLERVAADRFRFHVLVRAFAATLAGRDDRGPELRQAVGRLIDYFLDTTDRCDRVLHPYRRRFPVSVAHSSPASPPAETVEQARQWMELQWRDILRAARYAGEHEWTQRCADLVHVLGGFLETRAYWDEAIIAHTLALQACRDLDAPPRIAQSLLELSHVSQQTGQHGQALPLAEEAVRIYRSLRDQRGEADALDRLGMAHYYSAAFREALAHFHEANRLYRHLGRQHGEAVTLDHMGLSCWHLGRYADAIRSLDGAIAIYRDLGDRRGEAKLLNNIGDFQRHQGYHRDALRNYEESLRIFGEIGGRWNHAILYSNVGSVHRYKGDNERALSLYGQALSIFKEVGDLRYQAASLNDIGTAYQGMDNYKEALTHHRQARTMAEQIGDSRALMIAHRGMADAYRRLGQHAEAQESYLAAVGLAKDISDPLEEARALAGIAETTLRTKGPQAARIRLREALDILEQIGSPEAETVRVRLEALDFADRQRAE